MKPRIIHLKLWPHEGREEKYPFRIDLTDKNNSPLKYERMLFNDGEPHIEIEPIDRKRCEDGVEVKVRIASMNDLYELELLHDILQRQGLPIKMLFITYLMSMRMDRVFSLERPYSLSVMARHINALNARKVFVLEPHSGNVAYLINNCKEIDWLDTILKIGNGKLIVNPDLGAQRRFEHAVNMAYKYTPAMDSIFNATAWCEKHRDGKTGRIISLDIEKEYSLPRIEQTKGQILVVDDLCDGGGTFLLLAEKLRGVRPDASLELFVTHMVNPEGLRKVSEAYDHVYITDSFADWSVCNPKHNVTYIKI